MSHVLGVSGLEVRRDGRAVVTGVTFTAERGERVALMGPSGSGKTTVVNLLSRFYDVDDGRVCIDGVDIRELDQNELRPQMGVVLQEPTLFSGTIYENLAFYSDASPEDVAAAARLAARAGQ